MRAETSVQCCSCCSCKHLNHVGIFRCLLGVLHGAVWLFFRFTSDFQQLLYFNSSIKIMVVLVVYTVQHPILKLQEIWYPPFWWKVPACTRWDFFHKDCNVSSWSTLTPNIFIARTKFSPLRLKTTTVLKLFERIWMNFERIFPQAFIYASVYFVIKWNGWPRET